MSKEKHKTSILYFFTNRYLETSFLLEGFIQNTVLVDEEQFRKALAEIWRICKKIMLEDYDPSNSDYVFNDARRRLSKDDFKIHYRFSLKKDPMLFIEFPEPIGKPHREAKCLCVLFNRDNNSLIRMFTMEYYDEEPDWTFKGHFVSGEWIHENGEIIAHRNMGLLKGSDVASFMDTIGRIFANENPDKIIQDNTLLINDLRTDKLYEPSKQK